MANDKPTLTPHSDELEKVIPAFIANVRRDMHKEGQHAPTAALTEAILLAALRAIAKQRDLGVKNDEILYALEGAIANTIMSAVCTLNNADSPRSLISIMNIQVFMANLARSIATRVSDPDLIKDATVSYKYDNPDRKPMGRA